jgi:hypothetical protein
MKKFLIIIALFIISSSVFADERFVDDRFNSSLKSLSTYDENRNGAYYSATLHFQSKGTLYYSGIYNSEDMKYIFISDGVESYFIPCERITEVYWRYPISISELEEKTGEDISYILNLLNEMKKGDCYKAHTEYRNYDNYLAALERGEDAKFISFTPAIASK